MFANQASRHVASKGFNKSQAQTGTLATGEIAAGETDPEQIYSSVQRSSRRQPQR